MTILVGVILTVSKQYRKRGGGENIDIDWFSWFQTTKQVQDCCQDSIVSDKLPEVTLRTTLLT